MKILKIVSSIILGLVVGFAVFYFSLISREGVVVVPNVLGKECDSAVEDLRDIGLHVEKVGEGKVIGLSVRSGMEVKRGRKIRVVCGELSSIDPCSIKGASLEFAKEFIENLGLELEVSMMRHSGNTGQVLDCRVWNGKVWVLIDSGKRAIYRPVPNLVGMRRDEVEDVLKSVGLEYDITGNGEKVISQFPEPGGFATEVILKTER